MSEEEKKFLEIVDLKKGFGSGETRQEVLRGMNFSVAKGEFCVLLGPSGSGKSTLLNIIGGIDSADSGYISINGDKLEDMSEKKLTQYRRKHLGYVFQMYNLIANLNVKENIEVGAYLSDNALDIDELLQTLGLYEHRYKLPNQLSGGQQQRVSIGRAIVKNPDILLCDEPTGALDYNTSKEILKLIEDVNKKYGNTIIMVTHNEAIRNMGRDPADFRRWNKIWMRFCLYPGLLCETGGRVCRWETADLYSDRISKRIPHNGDQNFRDKGCGRKRS
jgi:putative ABC transport system ATP-binding protein